MKIVAIMGKSASGKDTILNALLNHSNGNLHQIVSCTTRPPREGEVDGFDYNFITNEQMAELIFNGRMIECCVFNEWGYGTCEDDLNPNKINVGVYNPEGVEILKDSGHDILVVYCVCNDKLRLMRSLQREQRPNVSEIVRRYSTDEKDFQNAAELADLYVSTESGDVNGIAELISNAIEDWTK